MYTYAAISDIGPCYTINDDRVLVQTTIIREEGIKGQSEKSFFLAAICDGVGGMAKGYEAAELTLEHLKKLNAPEVQRNDIRKVIEDANKKIVEKQIETGCINGMRTTLVAFCFTDNVFYVVNAGDSRGYRYRNGKMELLTRDHSVVQNMIDAGEITEEEARVHPKRNIITKCIGDEERVNARIIEHIDNVFANDLYILCSDGVSDCLTTEHLKLIIEYNKELDLLEIGKMIIREAIRYGSTDNISVCLIRKEK